MTERRTRLDSSEKRRENRFDVGASSLGAVRETPQGFLHIPAVLTRTGVLTYTRADGSTVKELRHPDEVFKDTSLASLNVAPVTDDHPGIVTPDNVSNYQIGVLSGNPSHDGRLVNGSLVIQRRDAIDKVKIKTLKEVSPGYTCVIDPTPGEWEGEHYDQAQKDIIYNHIALGPAGWGRSGPEVALRMDAAVSGFTELRKKEEIRKMKKIRVTLDGVTFEIEVPNELAATFETGLERLQTERQDVRKRAERAEGSKAVAEGKLAELQKRFDAETSAEAINKRAAYYARTLDKARAIAPEEKFDGLGLNEMRKKALAAAGMEIADDKSEAFVEGAFETFSAPKAREDSFPHVSGEPKERADGKKINDVADARTRMLQRQRNAWKGEKAEA